MTPETSTDQVVFSTKWFQILTRPIPGSKDPHYVFAMTDFVTVVALTTDRKLILVRQYRPAAGRMTLELPSGHVEKGETPEIAARKELLEETGFIADKFEFLSVISPAIGRFSNLMHCFFAADARPTDDKTYGPEEGVVPTFYAGKVAALVEDGEFCSSLSHTALLAAIARGKLPLQ